MHALQVPTFPKKHPEPEEEMCLGGRGLKVWLSLNEGVQRKGLGPVEAITASWGPDSWVGTAHACEFASVASLAGWCTKRQRGSSRAAIREIWNWGEAADGASAAAVSHPGDRVGRAVPGVAVETSDSSLEPSKMESRSQPSPSGSKIFLTSAIKAMSIIPFPTERKPGGQCPALS